MNKTKFILIFAVALVMAGCVQKEPENDVISSSADTAIESSIETENTEETAEETIENRIYSLLEKQQPTKTDFGEDSIFEADGYDKYCFYDDFNNDGKYEAFAVKSFPIEIAHSGVYYNEIWYSDGVECEFIDSAVSMNIPYADEIDNKKFIGFIPFTDKTSSVNAMNVYTLTDDGKAQKCEPCNDECIFVRNNETSLFMCDEYDFSIKKEVYWNGTDFVAVPPSDEQQALSDFLYNNTDNTKMSEKALYLYECGYLKGYAEKELSEIYYCEEIFDDFNSDGKEELITIRELISDAPHLIYYDIWYTDGEICKCISDNTAAYFQYTYIDTTLVFCDFDTIVGGSSKQNPQCFIFDGNEFQEITVSEGTIVYGDINNSDFRLGIEKDDEYYNVKLDGTTLVIAE